MKEEKKKKTETRKSKGEKNEKWSSGDKEQ
jgi:hypothetical protein